MLNEYIESELFQKTIQRITFRNKIPLSELYYFTHMKNLITEPDKTNVVYAKQEYRNYEKKYGRLLKRLCDCRKITINNQDKSAPKASLYVSKPKVYDEFLLNSQIRLYNEPSKMIMYDPIENIHPIAKIANAATIDNISPSYDMIAKVFPYYPDDSRDGINFIEYILLINMYDIHYRSLITVNKIPKNDKDKTLVQDMVDYLTAIITNPKIYHIYIHMFYDELYDTAQDMYFNRAEFYTREILLPEKYRKRVDWQKAHKAYYSMISTNDAMEYENSQKYRLTNPSIGYECYINQRKISEFETIRYILGTILPITYHIAISNESNIPYPRDSRLYLLSRDYADIIKSYIDIVIEEAIEILNKVYTTNSSLS